MTSTISFSEEAAKRVLPQDVDFVAAPADYDELFRNYYDYVVGLVRKMGIDNQKKEDVASEILLRFYERDFLNKFDPNMVFTYQGEERHARFKSFLNAFVMAYVRNHRDRQNRLRKRELLICNMPLSEGGSTWIDIFGGSEHDDYSSIEEEELVSYLATYLAKVPRRSSVDRCDLPRLFEEVVKQVRTDGRCNVEQLQEVFGISSTAVHSWLGVLRTHVAAALERPLADKRAKRVPRAN